ncbi:hypothetical protein BDV12DRAFT_202716 [Aspergillus spectabilis]
MAVVDKAKVFYRSLFVASDASKAAEKEACKKAPKAAKTPCDLAAAVTGRRREDQQMTASEFTQAQVEQALAADQDHEQELTHCIPKVKHLTEVSPWPELARWPEYLGSQDLTAAAQLGAMPDLTTEQLLVGFADSVTRLIDSAYCTIRDHRINEFDQVQINTFFRKPGV